MYRPTATEPSLARRSSPRLPIWVPRSYSPQTCIWSEALSTDNLRKSIQDVVAEMDGTPLQSVRDVLRQMEELRNKPGK
jgi:hypothetical protein